MLVFTEILALFPGIGDLLFDVFALPEHLVTLGASILDLKSSWTSKVAFWVVKVAFRPLIVKIYIHKLPIHRMRAAG